MIDDNKYHSLKSENLRTRSSLSSLVVRLQNSAVFISWLNLSSRLVGLVVLVPIGLTTLPLEDFLVWQVFLSVLALGIVLDFGLSPTLSRFISYSFGGSEVSNEPDWLSVRYVFRLSRIVYGVLATFVLIVLLTVGSFYLSDIIHRSSNPEHTRLAWYFVAFSTSFQVFGLYQVAFLQGVQQIPKQQFSQCSAVVLASLGALVVLVTTEQLLLFTLIYLSMIPIAYFLNRRFIKSFLSQNSSVHESRSIISEIKDLKSFIERNIELIRNIWSSTWRSGMGVFAVLGFTHACGLIVAKMYEPAVAASCLLAFQVMRSVNTFSTVPFWTRIPLMSAYFSQKNEQKLLEVAISGMRKSYLVFVALVSVFILFGNNIISWLKPEVVLMSPVFLALLALAFFLERFGAAHMQLLAVKNIVKWHLANGFAVSVALIFLVISLSEVGIVAFPLSILIGNIFGYCVYIAWCSYKKNELQFPTFDLKTWFFPSLLTLISVCVWIVTVQ